MRVRDSPNPLIPAWWLGSYVLFHVPWARVYVNAGYYGQWTTLSPVWKAYSFISSWRIDWVFSGIFHPDVAWHPMVCFLLPWRKIRTWVSVGANCSWHPFMIDEWRWRAGAIRKALLMFSHQATRQRSLSGKMPSSLWLWCNLGYFFVICWGKVRDLRAFMFQSLFIKLFVPPAPLSVLCKEPLCFILKNC